MMCLVMAVTVTVTVTVLLTWLVLLVTLREGNRATEGRRERALSLSMTHTTKTTTMML